MALGLAIGGTLGHGALAATTADTDAVDDEAWGKREEAGEWVHRQGLGRGNVGDESEFMV